MLGSFSHGIQVMVVHPLPIMIFAARNDIAHITAFHGIVTVLVHQVIGSLHVAFVVACGSRCLMMHHQFDTFGVSILIQVFDIKIRIWSEKVENIILAVAEPVFPTGIPAFYQYLVETMLRSKINVLLYILRIGGVNTIRFHFRIIRFIQFYGRKIKCICPRLACRNHFPPYAYILHRLNPGSILILARIIQIQYQIGSQHFTGIITDYHRTPRSVTR